MSEHHTCRFCHAEFLGDHICGDRFTENSDYSYSLSVPIGRVDLLRSVVADLRELADSIEEDPDALVDTTLTIDPLRDVPRLKTFTVRVRIKPDGDSE